MAKRGGKQIASCDCETDPFEHGAEIKPFIWGYYDGKEFWTFASTKEFVEFVSPKKIILYAHNGGKFDFMFLLPFLGETKAQIINGRIVSMFLGNCELRDSYACVPVSMKEIQKDEIDYQKMHRDRRDLHIDEITRYLESDCRYLYELMTEYRSIAGKQKTIASNALAFAKKKGINIGRTNGSFDKKFRKFFFGGRCECFQPGSHEDISVLDIRSAYPFAMMHEHPTGTDFTVGGPDILKTLSTEEIQRCFIRLNCVSHGAFPQRGENGGLNFPNSGEYEEFFVTGWEYLAAMDLGLIENVSIDTVYTFRNSINFKPYVDHWYEYKRSHDKKIQPIQYTIGKIMMNSLYGKTAQDISNYFDYKIVPAGTPVETGEGWTLYTENAQHEIHRRESLWKYKFRYGVQWEGQNLFHNVATGASITGFTRAWLLRAMHTVGIDSVIYCDTDSIIAKPGAAFDRLECGPELGDWEVEADHCPIGHFAGKKLYGIKLPEGSKTPHKIACKGSRLMFDQLAYLVSGAGAKVLWKSETPTFSLDGTYEYLTREIVQTGNGKVKKSHGAEKNMRFGYSVYEKVVPD